MNNETNVLDIPLRQSRDLDLGNELREVIKRDYFQPPSIFEADLIRIGKLRNKITSLKDDTVNEDSERLLKEYYGNLLAIKTKFADECVEFQWYTTIGYGTQGPTKTRSIVVEQLNILYQLGALYSLLAKNLRYGEENLKKACNYYLLAGGCFEEILQMGINKPMVPGDLQGNTIKFLMHLMLAQAQETVWQKALDNDKINDSLIAKLSIQVSNYYEEAFEYGKASDLIKLEWINHIGVKKYHFKAAANYRMSLIKLHSYKYGEQVAYLRVALSNCKLALKFKKYVNSLVLADLQGLTEIVQTTLSLAERDNDLIYLQIVPGDNELKIFPSNLTINVIKLQFEESRIFKDLLPFFIIQVAQAYRERQDNYIEQTIVSPIHSLNNLITKFLTDRDLPASIDAIQQTENLPDSIVQHSQEIMGRGGLQYIEGFLRELNQLSKKCFQLVHQCQDIITLDSEEEEMLLQRGSHRADTQVAASDLIEKIKKMDDYLIQAKSGDDLIVKKYENIKSSIQAYCGGYQTLRDMIPDSKFIRLDKNISRLISDLRNAIENLNQLETSGQDFLKSLEIKSRDNNILPKIIEEYKKNHQKVNQSGQFDERFFEPVYENHMSMFNSDMKYIEILKSKQMLLEADVDRLNKMFIEQTKHIKSDSQNKRQLVLQNLESLYSLYVELISNLSEGSKFYGEFLSKGTVVLKECENYLYSRRVEGRQIEAELNHNSIINDEQSTSPKSQPKTNINLEPKSGIWDPSQGIKFNI